MVRFIPPSQPEKNLALISTENFDGSLTGKNIVPWPGQLSHQGDYHPTLDPTGQPNAVQGPHCVAHRPHQEQFNSVCQTNHKKNLALISTENL